MKRSWVSRAAETMVALIGTLVLLTYLEGMRLRRWLRGRWKR